MTVSIAYLVYAAVAVVAGLWARRQGYLGGNSSTAIPDLVPGSGPAVVAANALLRIVLAKLLDPATQAAALSSLHDVEGRLLVEFRDEVAVHYPGIAKLIDGLTQPAKPAA